MLALILPVLAHTPLWNRVVGALPLGLHSAPLVQLVLLQLLLLQAAFLAAVMGLQLKVEGQEVRKFHFDFPL